MMVCAPRDPSTTNSILEGPIHGEKVGLVLAVKLPLGPGLLFVLDLHEYQHADADGDTSNGYNHGLEHTSISEDYSADYSDMISCVPQARLRRMRI